MGTAPRKTSRPSAPRAARRPGSPPGLHNKTPHPWAPRVDPRFRPFSLPAPRDAPRLGPLPGLHKRGPEAGTHCSQPSASYQAIKLCDGSSGGQWQGRLDALAMGKFSVLQTQVFETIGPDLLFEKPGSGGHQSAPGVAKRPHSLTIQPPSAVDAGGGMQPQSMVVYRDCEGSECRESTTSSSYLGPDQDRTQEASVARPTKTARLHNSTRPIPMRNGKRTAKQVHEQAGRCMVNILARHPRLASRLNTSPAEVAPL